MKKSQKTIISFAAFVLSISIFTGCVYAKKNINDKIDATSSIATETKAIDGKTLTNHQNQAVISDNENSIKKEIETSEKNTVKSELKTEADVNASYKIENTTLPQSKTESTKENKNKVEVKKEIQTEVQITTETTTEVKAETTTEKAVKSLPCRGQNSFELELFNLVNNARVENGLTPLKWSNTLHGVAIVRAEEACTQRGHTRPNGEYFSSVFAEYNVMYYSVVGENLAYTSDDAELVFRSLMNSPTHKGNILRNNFTSIGIAVVYDSNGVPNVAQIFGA